MSIRDEVSKIVDVRIPPNGYRKYLKSLSRTGAFQQVQYEDSLIALFEAVEELEKKVVVLNRQMEEKRFFPGEIEDIKVTVHPQVGEGKDIEVMPPREENPEPIYKCTQCEKTATTKAGMLSHERSHKDAKSPTGSETPAK